MCLRRDTAKKINSLFPFFFACSRLISNAKDMFSSFSAHTTVKFFFYFNLNPPTKSSLCLSEPIRLVAASVHVRARGDTIKKVKESSQGKKEGRTANKKWIISRRDIGRSRVLESSLIKIMNHKQTNLSRARSCMEMSRDKWVFYLRSKPQNSANKILLFPSAPISTWIRERLWLSVYIFFFASFSLPHRARAAAVIINYSNES